MESIHLPFSLPKVYQGFAVGNGIATATNAGLTLEFEIKDSIMGVLKSEIRNIQIPIAELYSVDLKDGWFGTKIFIRTRTMATLSSIPGSETGNVELRIARKDKAPAASLVSILRLGLSENELAKLEGGIL